MAAAMTGLVTEYCPASAERLASKYLEEKGIVDPFNNPIYVLTACAGDHNDHNPDSYVSVWPTPGWFNDGLGGHFRTEQETEALEHYKQECLKEAKKQPIGISKDSWIEKSKESLHKHYAYLSVAVFFMSQPTPEIMKDMFFRAKKYAKENDITVTNCRLIKEEVVHTEINIEV